MPESPNKVERLVKWAHTHKLVSVVVVILFVATAIATVVEAFTTIIGATSKSVDAIATALHSEKPTVTELQAILAERHGTKPEQVSIDKASWLDLSASGVSNELAVVYTTQNRYYRSVYTKLPDGSLKRIYNNINIFGDLTTITYDNMSYVVYFETVGNAGFLSLAVLQWDGVAPMRVVPVHTSELDHDDTFSSGHLYVIHGKLYVKGAGKRFVMERSDGEFVLKRLIETFKYPELGEQVNILTVTDDADGHVAFAFNDKPHVLQQTGDGAFRSREPIELWTSDMVLINELFMKSDFWSMFTEYKGNLLVGGDIYDELSFEKEGEYEVRFRYNYDDWFTIVFDVRYNF